MEVLAKYKQARLSAQKARLVADQIRGLAVNKALDLLNFSTKKAAAIIKKTLGELGINVYGGVNSPYVWAEFQPSFDKLG